MPHFKKSILRVGTHHSPDGPVRITPQRLRHFAKMHKRLKANNQTVPVDWDHADDPTKAVPMSVTEFQRKKRSAKNTVGHLHEFKVARDGRSAEITLDLHRKSAVRAAKDNTIFISPVIFEKWRDGGSNSYSDVITHVDFVNHPVDSSQSPFKTCKPNTIACALRMGLDTGHPLVYRFAHEDEEGEDYFGKMKKKRNGDDEDDEDIVMMEDDGLLGSVGKVGKGILGAGAKIASIPGKLASGAVSMLGEDDDEDEDDDYIEDGDETESEDIGDDDDLDIDLDVFDSDVDVVESDDDDTEGPDMQTIDEELGLEEEVDEEDIIEMGEDELDIDIGAQVLSDLESAGIAPPDVDPTTNTEKFLLQLCAALKQKKMDEGGGIDEENEYNLDTNEGDFTVTEPEFATMGLRLKKSERRANSLHAFAERQYKMSLKGEIEKLHRTGRATERESRRLISALNRTRLSLSDTGTPKRNDISKWIKCRKLLPEGACQPADTMLRMSTVIDPPDQLMMDEEVPVTKQTAREYVDEQSERHPGLIASR